MPTAAGFLALVAFAMSCNTDIPEYHGTYFNHQLAQDPTPFLEASPLECADGAWHEVVAASFAAQPQGWDEMCIEVRYRTSIGYYPEDNNVPNGCLPRQAVVQYFKKGNVVALNERDPLFGDKYTEFDAEGREVLDISDSGSFVQRKAYGTQGEILDESWDDDEDGIIRGQTAGLLNFNAFLDEQGVTADKNGFEGEHCGRTVQVEWDGLTPTPPNPPIVDKCRLTVVAKTEFRRFVGDFAPPTDWDADGYYYTWVIEELDEKGRPLFIGKYTKPYKGEESSHLISGTELAYDNKGQIIAENTDTNGDGIYEEQLLFKRTLDFDGTEITTISRVVNEPVSVEPETLIVIRTLGNRLLGISAHRQWEANSWRCDSRKDVTDYHNLLPCLTGLYNEWNPMWLYTREYDTSARPIRVTIRANYHTEKWSLYDTPPSEEILWTYDGSLVTQRSYTVASGNTLYILNKEAEGRSGDTFYEYDDAGNVTRELYGGPAGMAREWLDIRRHCRSTTVQQK